MSKEFKKYSVQTVLLNYNEIKIVIRAMEITRLNQEKLFITYLMFLITLDANSKELMDLADLQKKLSEPQPQHSLLPPLIPD